MVEGGLGQVAGRQAGEDDRVGGGVLGPQVADLQVVGRVVPASGRVEIGKLDDDQVAAPRPLDRVDRAAVDEEPSCERLEGGVDTAQVLDELRAEVGAVDGG